MWGTGVGRRLQHSGIHAFDQCLVWKEAFPESREVPRPFFHHLNGHVRFMTLFAYTPLANKPTAPVEAQGLVTKDLEICTTV